MGQILRHGEKVLQIVWSGGGKNRRGWGMVKRRCPVRAQRAPGTLILPHGAALDTEQLDESGGSIQAILHDFPMHKINGVINQVNTLWRCLLLEATDVLNGWKVLCRPMLHCMHVDMRPFATVVKVNIDKISIAAPKAAQSLDFAALKGFFRFARGTQCAQRAHWVNCLLHVNLWPFILSALTVIPNFPLIPIWHGFCSQPTTQTLSCRRLQFLLVFALSCSL